MKPNLTTLTKALRINQTPWELKLWNYLRANKLNGFKFKRQVPVGRYIVDFCCQDARLIIELDGGHHSENETSVKDAEKERDLKSKGYKVLHFWNNEVDSNIEGVMEVILNNIDLSPNLSPSPGERGSSSLPNAWGGIEGEV